MFLLRELGGFFGDLRFVVKFPKSHPKNRNRENLAKWPHVIVNGPFSAGLWPQKTPWPRAFLDAERNFLSFGDSVAEGVGFEPTRDFHPCRFSRPVPSTARPPLQALLIRDLRRLAQPTNRPSRAALLTRSPRSRCLCRFRWPRSRPPRRSGSDRRDFERSITAEKRNFYHP
jgi:hypothetical protein